MSLLLSLDQLGPVGQDVHEGLRLLSLFDCDMSCCVPVFTEPEQLEGVWTQIQGVSIELEASYLLHSSQ